GILLLIFSAIMSAFAIFSLTFMVFGCVKSPPDWLYLILVLGFPLPLIFGSIIIPYLYIQHKKFLWILLSFVISIFLSILIYIVWFLILTQYC
ncbi:MAG: hypothetical protein R2942_19795, partial [Ignavibacteria bacterium]